MFVPPVRRVDTKVFGKPSHYYIDGNKRRIPGVTTILNDGVPKPALVAWAGNTTAEYAVDHWDELADLKPSERLKLLKGIRYEQRDAAANRGTEVHALAERLVLGEEVDVPDELAGHVESYVRFLDEWRPEPVLTEVVVVNYTIGFAGTLDTVVDMAGQRWLLDLKTSRGVYGETALQCAAYANAEFYVDADGNEQPMLAVDRTAVLHVRSDGYDLRPLYDQPQAFLQFRYAAAVARAMGDMKEYVGEALPAPVQEVLA